MVKMEEDKIKKIRFGVASQLCSSLINIGPKRISIIDLTNEDMIVNRT